MLKIENRKNTTKAGLDCLQAIIDNLNLKITPDIRILKSSLFPARVSRDNGCIWGDVHYCEWTNTEGCWKIKDGDLFFNTCNETDSREYSVERCDISKIFRLNFQKCIATLTDLVEKYNQAAAEKDEEIDKFLTTFQEYRK